MTEKKRPAMWMPFFAVVLYALSPLVAHASPMKEKRMEMLGGPGGLDMIASTAVADILTKNHPAIRVSPVKTKDVDSHFALAEKRDPNQVIYALHNNSYVANVMPESEDAHCVFPCCEHKEVH